ncbi:MAG: transglycosylase SLT domain-containing protein, partial [Thermodesulfovibrionia bacterium]|nr:transglycosylase SLT domain-containing protein [Thermodesulfovibrionia bacterium]
TPNIFVVSYCKRFLVTAIILTLAHLFINATTAAANPWQALQKSYEHAEQSEVNVRETDPWSQLRAVYLPFTEKEETQALKDPATKNRVAGKFIKALAPYQITISEAADMFNIPPEIIAAVIMVESGGNAHAKAKTSSAKGLMQTINATFMEARNGLLEQNIQINESPFIPRSSIFAGSWYLNKMYKLVQQDNPLLNNNRRNLASWKMPLEYYYAGPGNGQKKENIIIIYSGGKKILIDKQAYSRKVIDWAKIMEKKTTSS